jgi:hypothetical protein
MKVSFLRQHMCGVEGHSIDNYAFALCNIHTYYNRVALTQVQESTQEISSIICDGKQENGDGREVIHMVHTPHTRFQPQAPKAKQVIPQAKMGGGGLFSPPQVRRSSTATMSLQGTPIHSSAPRTGTKSPSPHDEDVVAGHVALLNRMHTTCYIRAGLPGLMHVLGQKHKVEDDLDELLGNNVWESPAVLSLPFLRFNRMFYGVWSDFQGVKIGCVACANSSHPSNVVRGELFIDASVRKPGISIPGSNKNTIANFMKHCGSGGHAAAVNQFLDGRDAVQQQMRLNCEKMLSALQSGETDCTGIAVKQGKISAAHALECTACETLFGYGTYEHNLRNHCTSSAHRNAARNLSKAEVAVKGGGGADDAIRLV